MTSDKLLALISLVFILFSWFALCMPSECCTRQRKALKFLPASSSSQSVLKALGSIVEGFSTPKHWAAWETKGRQFCESVHYYWKSMLICLSVGIGPWGICCLLLGIFHGSEDKNFHSWILLYTFSICPSLPRENFRVIALPWLPFSRTPGH